MAKTIYSTTSAILHNLQQDLTSSSTRATLANLRESMMQDDEQSSAIWQLLFENIPKRFLSRTGEMTPAERSIISALQLYALHQRGSTTTVNVFSKHPEKNWGTFNIQFRDGRFVVSHQVIDNKIPSFYRSFEHAKEATRQLEIWQKQVQNVQHQRETKEDTAKPTYAKDLGKSLHQLRGQYTDTQAIDRRFNTMIATDDYEGLVLNLRSLISLLKSQTTVTVDYAQLAHDLFQILTSSHGANQVKVNWSQSYFYKGDK